MGRNEKRFRRVATFVASIAIATPALAQTDASRIDDLEAKTAAMVAELAELRAELAEARRAQSNSAPAALETKIAEAVRSANSAERSASEWKNATTAFHVAGYAAAGYTSPENGNASFDVVNFNPIFHFQYGDRLLWESELEVEVDEAGDTEIGLEYSAINVLLNDHAVVAAGKFLSPLGYFRQNLHPAWINKLASAPPGFGHDAAAPAAEVGVQLRGGARVGEQSKFTYAAYVGNGPKLEAEDGELHGADTSGFPGDADDEKVIGARVSFLPVPKLELGFSGATGDAAIVEEDGFDLEADPKRGYQVLGADFAYQWNNLDLRGEYIQQDIEDESGSVAPDGGAWETWYVQSAYKFAGAKWEGVVRYTDYDSPHADQVQEQWAVGLNYLLAPNAMLKIGYEFNDGLADEATDDDRFLIQMAYGY